VVIEVVLSQVVIEVVLSQVVMEVVLSQVVIAVVLSQLVIEVVLSQVVTESCSTIFHPSLLRLFWWIQEDRVAHHLLRHARACKLCLCTSVTAQYHATKVCSVYKHPLSCT